MTVYVGIDPGYAGALVALTTINGILGVLPMPRVKGSTGPLDTARIWSWLTGISGTSRGLVVALERVGFGPQGGRASIQTAAMNWGRIDGLLVALGCRYVTPTPQQWQKRICPGSGDPKARSIAAARRLFPSLDLTPGRRVKPHDGIADAACLAAYARRTL